MKVIRIKTQSGHPHWCERTTYCESDLQSLDDLHHIGYRSRMFVEKGSRRLSVGVHRYDVINDGWSDAHTSDVEVLVEDMEVSGNNGEPLQVRSWMTSADARALAHMLLSQADLADRETEFVSNAGVN